MRKISSAVFTAIFASSVVADSVTIQYSLVYSGTQSPIGVNPWLTATLADMSVGGEDAVLLTLDASGLSNQEFASSFFFNFRESIDPGTVQISEVSRQNFTGQPTFSLASQNSQIAGGGYLFDLKVALPFPVNARFGSGSVYSVRLERAGGLNIYDLLVETVSQGYGGAVSVVHVQSLSDGSSAWISPGSTVPPGIGGAEVPEPSTWAAGVAMAGLVVFPLWRRRRS